MNEGATVTKYRRWGRIALLSTSLALSLTEGATASAGDAVELVLKRQTVTFSDASSRNDLAAMNGLLDDDVLFSNGNGTVQRDEQRDKLDTVSALLKRQTQALLDARARGDRAAATRYLDPSLLVVNADGDVSGRRNFPVGAPATPPMGSVPTITLTDWVVHHSGDVAVASFTADEAIRDGGPDVHRKFISVDSWVKRGSGWHLLGSQTIRLNQDPPAVTLPPEELDRYVGAYAAGPGAIVTIARDDRGLTLSTNGAKPISYVAESRDDFFVPGQPPGSPRTRISFQRDAGGRITGYVSRTPGVGNLMRVRSDTAAAPNDPAAPPSTVSSTLVLRNFTVRHVGDVAVATFRHDKATNYYGQIANTAFRSTETWIKRGTTWKMIASQGCELPPDPHDAGPSPVTPAGK
jgi:ketosteroid isomerase-like protein